MTIRIPIFKPKFFQFSYFIRSARLWNFLPIDIRSGEQSPDDFKMNLEEKIFFML